MPDKRLILIVDDEPDFVSLLQCRLEFEGYEVVSAGDGQDGFELLDARKPDIVILDLMMPVMDGFEFLSRRNVADERVRKIPVLIVTAFGALMTDEQRKIIADVPVFHKPFEMVTLLKFMGELIGK
ncbi:MAG: response regulator [bacterium]